MNFSQVQVWVNDLLTSPLMMLSSQAQGEELKTILSLASSVLNHWELPYAKQHSALVMEFLSRARVWISHKGTGSQGMLYGGDALMAKWDVLKTKEKECSVKVKQDLVQSMASFAQLFKKKDDLTEFRAIVQLCGKRSVLATQSKVAAKKAKIEDSELNLFD